MKFSFKKNNKLEDGFTIIETMIAVSLFVVIVTIGMGALLNANLLHQKSQNMRSIIDNLSFIMEDMSRNLRTGSTYRCIYDNNFSTNLNVPRSCANGGAIAFQNSTDGNTWIYSVDSGSSGLTYRIRKSVDGGTNWVQLNPTEVIINSISGFSVTGAEPPSGDTQQPFVSIRLVGSIIYQNVTTPFSLQTSVSQRLVDI